MMGLVLATFFSSAIKKNIFCAVFNYPNIPIRMTLNHYPAIPIIKIFS